MKKIEDYFQQNSLNNVLFQPEYECAKAIRVRVGNTELLTGKEADDILTVYNETNARQHYGGSGSGDYQIHLRHLLTIDNFKVQVDDSNGQMRINAG